MADEPSAAPPRRVSPARGQGVRADLARERVRAQLFGLEPASTTIDRFTLLECIGSGGMGTVYAAYDPRLDRRVALKLLRDDLELGTDESRQRQTRLLREARAMAKLSHPNVGAVHDAGACASDVEGAPTVWIAMEFIDGEGLGQWCRRAQPDVREILEAYVQMGRGLAAAHAVGLVHRDVKPDNAMRDRTGRVRVLDFGLARPAETAPGLTQVDLAAIADLDVDVFTQTGAVVGTPAYMAPELFDGVPADARSDQYGFCIALFEALWGVRPHGGSTPMALAEERRQGRIVDPPRRRNVPSPLRAILARGLAADPEQRWPSMDALLHAIERVRSPRRRRALALVSGAIVVGGVGWFLVPASPAPCDGADAKVIDAWSDGHRERVRTALSVDPRAFVPAATAVVIDRFDGYARSLSEAYRESCLATHETHIQSEELLDRQVACLDVRRTRMQSLVALFETADEALVERATTTVETLDPIAPCRDRAALLAVGPPDPSVVSAVVAVEQGLADASAARHAGRSADARRLATGALERAEQTAYLPVVARAHFELALALEAGDEASEALAHATEAHFAANASEQHDLAARAAEIATVTLAPDTANRGVARLWHRAGQASAGRSSDADSLRGRIDIALGEHLVRALEIPEARTLLERGLEARQRSLGPNDRELWDAQLLLARILTTDDPGRARSLAEQIRESSESQLADDPVRLAATLGSVAQVHLFAGDDQAAEPIYRRALDLAEVNLGLDHSTTNTIRTDLAMLMYRAQRPDEASKILEVTVASTGRKEAGEQHARALHMHAIVLKKLDRLDDALAAETRSLDWYLEHMPGASRALLTAYFTLGNIQLLRDDLPAAESAYLAAVELAETGVAPELTVGAKSNYANFLFQSGRSAEAVSRLREMLAGMRAAGSPPYEIAQYEFDLARALWRVGDHQSARRVATGVLEVLRVEKPEPQLGGHMRRDWTVQEVEEWFPDPDAWEET